VTWFEDTLKATEEHRHNPKIGDVYCGDGLSYWVVVTDVQGTLIKCVRCWNLPSNPVDDMGNHLKEWLEICYSFQDFETLMQPQNMFYRGDDGLTLVKNPSEAMLK
jgi:hypothetical protein